jgi:hypothetical protein
MEVNRILRSFDFEERRLGNVEEIPMHWAKVQGPGLPHYVNGRLTSDRARNGRYSFRLDLNGGSLVYRYQSGQIKVQPDAYYRVEGFVQTTVMPNARARVSAYLADQDGNAIEQTVRHSDLYTARGGEVDLWHKLAVEVAATAPNAAFLIIELSLLQPAAYASSELGERSLFPQDIRGSAWFDDVTVSQVPKVTLTTARPGNIFRRSDPLQLSVLVNDRFTEDLSAKLVLLDAMDQIVHQRSGALDMNAAETLGPGRKRMSLMLPGELPAGWYEARLEMSSQGQFVGRQTLDLIRLADDAKPGLPDGRFGVVATDVPFEGWSDLPDVLSLLSAGRVKLAVWNETGDVQQDDPRAFDRLLERLRELRITPTACLTALPPRVVNKLRSTDALLPMSSLAQLHKASQDAWQPLLAELIARHASHLDRWQLGADGSDAFVTDPRMRLVYQRVYREFVNLVQRPDVAMPWPAWYELEGELPATVALHVKPDVLPSQLPLYLQDIKTGSAPDGARSDLSVYLEPLDREQYGRETQIRDLAQRVAYALAADAKRIDVKLPFAVRRDDETVSKQPQELLIIVRTLMTMLGNASFKGKVPIADGVEAFLFDRNGQGVLMLWDRGSDAAVKQLALNLGERPVRVDLWGNVTPLLAGAGSPRPSSEQGGETPPLQITVGPMPFFLVDIDAQLAQLRASVAFDNAHIESSFKPHVRKLRFTNPYRSTIGGTVKLTAPKGWTINPPTCTFTLNPGETFDREVSMEFPYNSYAGPKTVTAQFQVQAENNLSFSVPLVLKLGLSDVGLQTIALRDGGDVIVQQMITNYGEQPIDYTAYAIFPGQARQERIVTKLAPGRTTIKKYRFPGVKFDGQAKVRSGLKELLGTRILNDEVAIQ